MGPARIAVLVIAAIAAIGAVFMMRVIMGGESDDRVIAETQPEAATVTVLAAARDLAIGERLSPEDFVWSEWPETAAAGNFVLQSAEPEAVENYTGAVVRVAMAASEPVLPGKVVKTGEAGFMSAMLSPGMRAVAIPIDVESGAGGFILPNDRVDVMLTRAAADAGAEGALDFTTNTILTNVRVLAIDQAFAEQDGEQTLVGSTATLELAPREAELVAQAGATGEIALALRSLADSVSNADEERAAGISQSPVRSTVQVYQYGAVSQVAVQDPVERAQ